MNYPFLSNIKYLFVKSRSFSNLKDTATFVTKSKLLGKGVELCGWNISPLQSSINLNRPEVLLQTIKTPQYADIITNTGILHDGIIHPQVSLGYHLLNLNLKNKYYIGIPERHNDGIVNPTVLGPKILKILKNKQD